MLHEMVVLWIKNHQEEWRKINKENGAVFTGDEELIAEFRKLRTIGVLIPEMEALFDTYLRKYEEELGFGKESGLIEQIMQEEQGKRKEK